MNPHDITFDVNHSGIITVPRPATGGRTIIRPAWTRDAYRLPDGSLVFWYQPYRTGEDYKPDFEHRIPRRKLAKRIREGTFKPHLYK